MADCEWCGEWTRPGKTERGESCGAQACERHAIAEDQSDREEARRRGDEDFDGGF